MQQLSYCILMIILSFCFHDKTAIIYIYILICYNIFIDILDFQILLSAKIPTSSTYLHLSLFTAKMGIMIMNIKYTL